jgi:pyruvate formate lyase activating enzyme
LENFGKKLWVRTPIIPNYTDTEENIKGIGEFIVNKLHNNPERWDLLSFNRLCSEKYSRLGIDWILKDEPLMTKEEIEYFFEIAKSTGVKFVHWSGLTRKKESQDGDSKNSKGKKLPSC